MVLAVAVILLVVVIAVGASAALDAPARSVDTATLIEAPREKVWDLVMDFDAYPEWNPYITSIRGVPAPGRTLAITIHPPGDGTSEIEAEVYTFHPPRKFRWQSRYLLPGLRDFEYEVIVAPVGPGRTSLLQRARFEGLLTPFGDVDSAQEGLELSAAALKRRVEATG